METYNSYKERRQNCCCKNFASAVDFPSVNFITTLSSEVRSLLFFGGMVLVELDACPARRLLSINAITSKTDRDISIQAFNVLLIVGTSILGYIGELIF